MVVALDEMETNAPKVVCISQARMASQRLPGKVLRPMQGAPMLHHHVARLQRAARVDLVVVATTKDPVDDVIERFCADRGVLCYRGPDADVLTRFAGCARRHEADVVVRVTADCPLIDPMLVDRAVAALLDAPEPLDYVNLDLSQYPRGVDVEAFRRAALEAADQGAASAFEREHVTPFIYQNPDLFRRIQVPSEHPAVYRWCVDEPADFELVSRMIGALLPEKPDFTWLDCIALMRDNPGWAAINAHVRQKPAPPR